MNAVNATFQIPNNETTTRGTAEVATETQAGAYLNEVRTAREYNPSPFAEQPFSSQKEIDTTVARAELTKLYEVDAPEVLTEIAEIATIGAHIEMLRHETVTEKSGYRS